MHEPIEHLERTIVTATTINCREMKTCVHAPAIACLCNYFILVRFHFYAYSLWLLVFFSRPFMLIKWLNRFLLFRRIGSLIVYLH